MLFCPICSTKLSMTVVMTPVYKCANCPYRYEVAQLEGQVAVRVLAQMPRARKQAAEQGAEAQCVKSEGDGGQITSISQCPNSRCDSKKASFVQLQIRSADEPMSLIFTCVKCQETWRLE